jgi:transcriptional regulator with XRE-family HTH domain
MSTETWLQKQLRSVAGQVTYETERLIIAINEEIVKQMVGQKVTRTELAERLGVDKAHVTRMLNGTPNMTLKTLASVASALGCRFSVPTLARIDKRRQLPVGQVVKFDRPVTCSLATSAEAFRPLSEPNATDAVTWQPSLEVDADASAAAA